MFKKQNITKLTIFGLVLFSLIIIFACEDDDICSELETTPNMIVVFRNSANNENLTLSNIQVSYDGAQIVNQNTTDSISFSLPLESRENLILTFQKESSGTTDAINLSYTAEQEFVSKACGFRVVYKNITLNSYTENEIENIEQQSQEITNESSACLYIYYND